MSDTDSAAVTCFITRHGKPAKQSRRCQCMHLPVSPALQAESDCRLKLPKDRSQDELQAVIPDLPPGLTTSFNLGCLDVYPATSGKHHAGSYLLAKFGVKLERSVLLCDDDNDLGLAAVVSRAFLPSLTSDSIRAAAAAHPDRFVTSGKGAVLATEDMLQHVEDVLDSYTS